MRKTGCTRWERFSEMMWSLMARKHRGPPHARFQTQCDAQVSVELAVTH